MTQSGSRSSPLSLLSSVLFVLLCVLGAWGFLRHTATHGRAAQLQEMRKRGVAEEALANEPPWVIVDHDGSLSGIGPEVDRAALSIVGVHQLHGHVMDYGAMIPALQANRVDMVSSGSQDITPQRCKKVLFSEPVLCDRETFLSAASVARRVKTYADIATAQLRVGVCGGCVEQRYALRAGVPADHVLVFPDGLSAIKMLQASRIDLIALPQGSLQTLVKTAGVEHDFEIGVFANAPVGCSAASFRKQDVALRDAYNRGLSQYIASGRYAELLKRYGLESLVALRQGKTAAGLCSGE